MAHGGIQLPWQHFKFVEFPFGSRRKIVNFGENNSIYFCVSLSSPCDSIAWKLLIAMPEQQIPAYERPSSSSSSEPVSQEHSLGVIDERRNNANDRENQFVAIRNLMNNNRTSRSGIRPMFPHVPFERSFIPAPTRYYPIVIPAEPTIEDLLVSIWPYRINSARV